MVSFKTFQFKAFSKSYALSFLLLLGACSNNVEDLEKSSQLEALGTASFIANETTGSASSISNQNALWSGIESQKRIDFNVCLKDRAFINRPVLNQKLTLVNDKNERINATTDINGCFKWHEIISYDFTANETYYKYPVRLLGAGEYTGSLSLNLAVNPWKNGPEAVKDLAHKSGIETANNMSLSMIKGDATKDSNIVIKALRIHNKASSLASNAKANLQVILTPMLRRQALSGEVISSINGTGKFILTLQLFKEVDGEEGVVYPILSQNKEVLLKDREIKTTFDNLEGLSKLDANSTYYYNVELSPIGNRHLSDVKAFFKSRDLFGKTLSEAFEYTDTFASAIDAQVSEQAHFSQAKKHAQFKIEEISNFRLGSEVSGKYNKSSNKIVRVKFNACMKDPVSFQGKSPLSETVFSVRLLDQKQQIDSKAARLSTSKDNGCIESYVVVTYDEFSRERSWQNYTLEIQALSGHYKGKTVKRAVALNPWNPEDLGYDLTRQTPPASVTADAPRIKIDSVGIEYNGNDSRKFKMNKFLHLTLHKKIKLNMRPMVELFHTYKKEALPTPLTYGKYKLTASIFTPKEREVNYKSPNLENFTLISTARKDVEVDPSSVIDEELSFPMLVSEAQFLGLKNLLLIEIEPKDKETGLRPGVFVLPIEALAQNKRHPAYVFKYYNQFIGVQDTIEEMAVHSTKLPGASLRGNIIEETPHDIYKRKLEELARANNGALDIFDLKAFNKDVRTVERISESDMAMLATAGEMPKKVLKKFCSHLFERNTGWFADNKEYDACVKNPKKAMSYSPSIHIIELYNAKKEIDRNGDFIGTYAMAKHVSSSQSKITRAKAHAVREGSRWYKGGGERNATGFSAGFSPFFMSVAATAMKSYEMYQVEDEGDLQIVFGGNSAVINLPELDVNSLKVRVKATVKECVTVSNIKSTKSLHLCADRVRKKYIEEEWFFVGESQSLAHGALSDGNKFGNNTFKQVIRGRRNFEKLWKNLKREAVLLVVQEVDNMDMSKTFKDYQSEGIKGIPFESFVDNSFPGMIIPTKTITL